jgi:hypothetical protein
MMRAAGQPDTGDRVDDREELKKLLEKICCERGFDFRE